MTNLDKDLEVLNQAKKMKDDGANNTQIRAYLEEHGMKNIEFENDDIGENPGVPPILRQRNLPDKSVGERESWMDLYRVDPGPDRPDHKLDPLLTEPLPEGKTVFAETPTIHSESSVLVPVFNAVLARRHLYKSLIVRMNEELAQGPLAGLITITGVRRENDPNVLISVSFELTVKMVTTRSGDLRPSFKAMNRSKAYATYFTNLRRKYILEIRESEDKVMERE